uniref:Uncharacterized protein n=1 Tax=Anguilla anguilla TaxID=7936 RepID=A0A0E9PSZ2_ANGAN
MKAERTQLAVVRWSSQNQTLCCSLLINLCWVQSNASINNRSQICAHKSSQQRRI